VGGTGCRNRQFLGTPHVFEKLSVLAQASEG
jgi:hypothetical protein